MPDARLFEPGGSQGQLQSNPRRPGPPMAADPEMQAAFVHFAGMWAATRTAYHMPDPKDSPASDE